MTRTYAHLSLRQDLTHAILRGYHGAFGKPLLPSMQSTFPSSTTLKQQALKPYNDAVFLLHATQALYQASAAVMSFDEFSACVYMNLAAQRRLHVTWDEMRSVRVEASDARTAPDRNNLFTAAAAIHVGTSATARCYRLPQSSRSWRAAHPDRPHVSLLAVDVPSGELLELLESRACCA